MVNDETKFKYSVNPRRQINEIKEVGSIRKNCTLNLTKDQVRTCLKTGAIIYRRFSPSNIVRVFGIDLDRLHNEKFYSEEEWNKMQETKGSDDVTTPEEPVVDESDNNTVGNEGSPAEEVTDEEAVDSATMKEDLEKESEPEVAGDVEGEVSTEKEKDQADAKEGNSEDDATFSSEPSTVDENVNVEAEDSNDDLGLNDIQIPAQDSNNQQPQYNNKGKNKKKRH